MSTFSRRMTELARSRALSVRTGARLANVSPSYWNALATGRSKPPSREIALAIDQALGADGELLALAAPGPSVPMPTVPLLDALPAPRERLHADDVERTYGTIRHLIDLDRQHGADDLSAVAMSAFRAAQGKVARGLVDPEVAVDARRAVAELAEVCGWLAYDADQQELSRMMFNEARLTAELAGDWHLETFCRDLLAMQALHIGRPEEALLMAQRAVAHPRIHGRMGAIFHLRRGRALAELGAEQGALDALARSRAELAGGMTSADSPWTWWIHEAEVCLHESLANSALGLHAQAAELSQRSMELLPPGQVRDWSVYLAYRVGVLVRAHAWDDAVVALGELRRRWPQTHSTRTANLVRAAAATPGAPTRVIEAAQLCLTDAR